MNDDALAGATHEHEMPDDDLGIVVDSLAGLGLEHHERSLVDVAKLELPVIADDLPSPQNSRNHPRVLLRQRTTARPNRERCGTDNRRGMLHALRVTPRTDRWRRTSGADAAGSPTATLAIMTHGKRVTHGRLAFLRESPMSPPVASRRVRTVFPRKRPMCLPRCGDRVSAERPTCSQVTAFPRKRLRCDSATQRLRFRGNVRRVRRAEVTAFPRKRDRSIKPHARDERSLHKPHSNASSRSTSARARAESTRHPHASAVSNAAWTSAALPCAIT